VLRSARPLRLAAGAMHQKGQETAIDRTYRDRERTAQTDASIKGGALLRLLWEKVLRPGNC
jgi:hypothetical protein